MSYPCSFCGEKRPQCLEFHHHEDNKEANVADLVNGRASLQRISREIEKCIVACKNCHADIHWREQNAVG